MLYNYEIRLFKMHQFSIKASHLCFDMQQNSKYQDGHEDLGQNRSF